MESALEMALRVLNERSALCRRMADAARGRRAAHSAARWDDAAREAEERAEMLRHFIERGWLRPSPDDEEDRPDIPPG